MSSTSNKHRTARPTGRSAGVRRPASDRVAERADTMGTNVYSAKDNDSMHKSLNGEFILYQVLLQRLLDKNVALPRSARAGLLQHFQPEDETDRKVMGEFDGEYVGEKAIHWYTRETCIYRILNKSLRTQNIDDVRPFAQLMRDLEEQLTEEKKKFVKEQKSSIIVVYRGQLISKDEINRLKSTVGELISMNSFLSTSTNRDKALQFARSRKPPNEQLTNLLLEIAVNVKSPSRPLADVKHLSAFADEEEILFMFAAIFRLDRLDFDPDNQLWRANLTLCGDNDDDLLKFKASLRLQLDGSNELVAIGRYFVQMQRYEEAEDHLNQLLDDDLLAEPVDVADCRLALARVLNLKGNYHAAVEQIRASLHILTNDERTDGHPLVAHCQNEWGAIATNLHDFPLAFRCYEKALHCPGNRPHVTYRGLSQLHSAMHNPLLALDSLDKAEKDIPEHDFASRVESSLEKGKILVAMGRVDEATLAFDQSLRLQRQVLGERHPDLGYTFSAMAAMFAAHQQFEKARQLIEQSQQIQLETLPHHHPDFGQTFEDLANLAFQQHDYPQALHFYQQAIDNRVKTLLPSHPLVTQLHWKMGHIHRLNKNYTDAALHWHDVLRAELERKEFGDGTLTPAFRDLADLAEEHADDEQAIHFALRALHNELVNKFHEDFSLVDLFRRLSQLFYRRRQLPEALLFAHRWADCHRRRPSVDRAAIQLVYRTIGKIYLKKSKFHQSLLFHRNGKARPSPSDLPADAAPKEKETETEKEQRRIADLHFERRHADEDELYFHRYLRRQLKTNEKDTALIADLHQILGNICAEKDLLEQALEHYLQLLQWKAKSRPAVHFSLIEVHRAIGWMYAQKGLFALALRAFHRSLDVQKRHARRLSASAFARTYRSIGQLFLDKFRAEHFVDRLASSAFDFEHLHDDADYFRRLLGKQQHNVSKNEFDPQEISLILAALHWETNDFGQTNAHLRSFVHRQLDSSWSSWSVALAHLALGQVADEQGISEQCVQHLRSAVAAMERAEQSAASRALVERLEGRIRAVLLPVLPH